MSETFWDRPDENDEHQPVYIPPAPPQPQPQRVAPQPQPQQQRQVTVQASPADFSIDDMMEHIGTETEQSILSDAELRLEQAQLYQMLLKADLFGNVQANLGAVDNVQREIKAFILQRLEILLGMRQQAQNIQQQQIVQVQSPFNELEVRALKDIAFKLTQGKSSEPEAQTQPVQQLHKVTGTIGSVSLPQQQQVQQTQPLRTAPAAPKAKNGPLPARTTKEYNLDKLSDRDAEEIARFELQRDLKNKRPEDMTEQERAIRNKEITERQKSLKAKSASPGLPIPTLDQQTRLYQEQVASNTNAQSLLNLINNAKKVNT